MDPNLSDAQKIAIQNVSVQEPASVATDESPRALSDDELATVAGGVTAGNGGLAWF